MCTLQITFKTKEKWANAKLWNMFKHNLWPIAAMIFKNFEEEQLVLK